MAAGSPEQARALPMLEYLLEEIQPSFGSSTQRKITAYENFTRFFFTAQPRYEQEHIELLLRGDKKTRGLMYCTGQVSFSKSLKKTAPKALALLARLLDEHENKDCVAFRTALLESSPALIKGLRLEKHLKGKKNSDAEAAEAVAAVLQQGKTSTREALPEEANEVLALKSSAAGPSAASHAQMMAAAKSAPAPAPQPRRAEATIDRSSQKGGFAAAWQVLTGFFKSRPTPKDMEKRGLLRTGRYFGARLDTVCRDHGSDGVPTILRVCFDRLRDFGIDEPGIFRVPGNTDDVQLLKKRFDYDDEIPEFGGFSCHTVAGLLKLYLRELPEPLMTFRRYDRFVNLYREENYQGIFDLVQELPPANCATMQYLIDELAYVSLHADENRMTPSNVAIVFSPNLLRPEVETYEAIARDTPATIGCLKVLIEDRCRKLTISKREKESKQALAAITSAEPAAAQPAPAPAAAAQSASTPSQTPPSTPPAHRGSLAPLPPPWVEYVDSSSGLCYFFNPETNVTQWERPGAPPPPPPSHLRTESTASSSPAPASSPPPSAPPSRQKRASILGPVGVEVLAREIADQSHAANLEMPDSSDDEAVYVDVDPETGVERTVVREDVQSSSTIPHMSAGSRQNRATTAAERAGASRPPVAKRESLMRVVVDDISVEDVDQMARFRSASRLVNVDDEEETNTGQHNEEPVVEEPEPEPEPEPEVLSPADNSGLPPFWSEHIDPESGKIFYFNSNTQESSWVRPRADSQAPEPASVGLCGVVQSELVESGGMQVHQLFVTDQWTEDTAGGCHPNNHTWRSNPQYRLTVPPEGEGEQIVGVTLEMTLQVEPGTDTPPAIGVYIFRSGGSSARKLYVTDADHVARSEFSLLAKTTVQFEVSPTPHQYIVMPCTFHPGHAGTFSLNFSSDRQLTLEPIPHEQQWQEARMAGQWTEATAGGCRNNRTWEKNPQHLLSLPNSCTTATPVILVLSQPTSVGPPEAIGLYVVSKLGHIVAKAAFMHAPEVHCQVSLLPEAGPFIIVPCTFEPGKVRPYVLSAFSHAGITLIHTL